jgi:hypothetical protein
LRGAIVRRIDSPRHSRESSKTIPAASHPRAEAESGGRTGDVEIACNPPRNRPASRLMWTRRSAMMRRSVAQHFLTGSAGEQRPMTRATLAKRSTA